MHGVPVGIVGVTLRSTPALVNPAGVQTVDFLDEAQTANFYADLFRLVGIRSLVLLIHEGGQQSTPPVEPSTCTNFNGPITSIVSRLRPEFGIVVHGAHTSLLRLRAAQRLGRASRGCRLRLGRPRWVMSSPTPCWRTPQRRARRSR